MVYAVVASVGAAIASLSPGIPPVWPASGAALVLCLLWGWRTLAGIALGAYLIFQVFVSGTALAWSSTALILALAATAQAGIGALVVRRFLAGSVPLRNDGDAAWFLLLAGPVACALGAAVVAVLGVAPEAKPTLGAVTTTFGWWAGNTLGVLLVAPILMTVWPGENRYRALWGHRVAVPLVVIAGLLAAGNLALDRIEKSDAASEESSLILEVYKSGLQTLPQAVAALESVERFYAASDEVAREEFAVFTRSILQWPGLQAVEWVPRVLASERLDFERAAREAGFPGYRIQEMSPGDGFVDAAIREEYFPGYFVEPVDSNNATIGLDFGAMPTRRAAMERAVLIADAAAAASVPLVQTGRQGIPVFVPVFQRGVEPEALDEAGRRSALRGFVMGVFDVERLLAPVVVMATERGLHYRVVDITPGYDAEVLLASMPLDALVSDRHDVEFGGRILSLEMVSAEPRWLSGTSLAARGYLGFSVLAAFLVGFAALGAVGRSAVMEAQVAARTEELRAREQDLAVTMDSIGDAVMATDAEGRVTRLNPVAEELTGWTQEAANGRPVAEVFNIINEQTRKATEIPVARVLETGKVQGLANHTILISRDGTERAIADSAAPIFGPDGAMWGVVLVFRDVSQERAAERRLEASERRFRELIEMAPYAIAVLSEGKFAYLNPMAMDLFGATDPAQIIGRDGLDIVHPDSLEKAKSRLTALHEEGVPVPMEGEKLLRLDGTPFFSEAIAVPYEHEGKPGALVMLRDVTAARLAEEERERMIKDLTEARQAAEYATRAKSAFLATMSHEIRTPMNGVVGMVDVLTYSSLTEHQKDLVRTIRDSAMVLLRIIDDILDFSKIEAGRLELEAEPVAITALVEGVCVSLLPLASSKDIDLVLFVSPEIPGSVLGDELRLRQVIYNLAGNAIKFCGAETGRRGRVEVRAEVVRKKPFTLLFSVEDNGIGMDQRTVEGLFQAFAQAEVSTTRRFGGSGLGLAICKRIVDLMGGTIEVESEKGVGSRFTVELGLTVPDEQLSSTDPDLSDLKCIVVGGPRLGADNLVAYLEHAGADTRIADDFDAAISASRSVTDPVVVVIEATEPVNVDDASNVRILQVMRGRRRRGRVQSPNVVLIDGDAMRRQSFLRAVAVASGRESPEIFHEDTDDLRGPGMEAPTIEAARAAGQLILVAEDDAINQKVIRQQLSLLGYAAEIASDGAVALEMWRRGGFALVLTDLHMPEFDGYSLAEAIRAEETGRQRIPIIALTANALRGEERRALDAGMDEYLTKPSPLETLRVTLHKWLPLMATKDAPQSVTHKGDSAAMLDVNVLKSMIGDDPDLVSEFLNDYRTTLVLLAQELAAAARAGNASQVGSVAHKLKSASRSVGAMQLGDICEQLERAGRSRDKDQVSHIVPGFKAMVHEVKRIINEALKGTTP
ncbi:MAG: CHASE domain-containing protein [Gammaproteobacteria bacterium]|nr:CHASE domain-containing protein [Gammaproteobacteria bacterium]